MSTEFFDNHELLQLDGMLLMDYKMWKGARANARSLYMALIGPREVKRAVAYRFACMFSKLVEIFIVQDREPEHSIRFIAVQLFSVPSIASELVNNLDLLYKMLQILQAHPPYLLDVEAGIAPNFGKLQFGISLNLQPTSPQYTTRCPEALERHLRTIRILEVWARLRGSFVRIGGVYGWGSSGVIGEEGGQARRLTTANFENKIG